MAKPSLNAFEEWFATEAAAPGQGNFVRFQVKLIEGANPAELLREHLAIAHDAFDTHSRALGKTAMHKWLEGQPGYQRAREYVNRTARRFPAKESEEAYRKRMAEREEAWIEKMAEQIRGSLHSWNRSLQSVLALDVKSMWSSRVVHALHEYHFTQEAERLYQTAKGADKLLVPLENSLEKFWALAEALDPKPSFAQKKMLRRFPIEEMRHALRALPLQRGSAHKREQLFVYRIRIANLRHTGKPKPEAIAELMTLDGFAHQFDLRTIERMSARFKTAKDGVK